MLSSKTLDGVCFQAIVEDQSLLTALIAQARRAIALEEALTKANAKIADLESRSRVLDVVQAYDMWAREGRSLDTLRNTVETLRADLERKSLQ